MKKGNADDIKYRKVLITTFINSIYLYDDKVTLIFNSGDKSVTVNDILLSEIEANDTKAEGLFIDKVGLPYREDITDLSCILLFFAETFVFFFAQGYNYIRE